MPFRSYPSPSPLEAATVPHIYITFINPGEGVPTLIPRSTTVLVSLFPKEKTQLPCLRPYHHLYILTKLCLYLQNIISFIPASLRLPM